MFEVWDLKAEGENGMCWTLIHQVGVIELAQRNLEETFRVIEFARSNVEAHINSNSLFTVFRFHPTEDIIFMDVANAVAAYSIKHGTVPMPSPVLESAYTLVCASSSPSTDPYDK